MNKKILAGLILGVLLMAAAGQVLAQTPIPTEMPSACMVRADVNGRLSMSGCPVSGAECIYSKTSDCAICCLLGTILYITDWVFVVLIALVMVFVLMGAFSILTAAGDTVKITKGKNYILWAAIGFGIGLLSRAVPSIVRFLVVGK